MSPLNTLIPRLQGKNSLRKGSTCKGYSRNKEGSLVAVDHLVDSQVMEEDRDGADDVVNETSCDKIDMSTIDLGNKRND